MTRTIKFGGGLGALLCVITVAGFGSHLQVAVKDGAQSIDDAIPTAYELKRLEVVTEAIPAQAAELFTAMAETRVAINNLESTEKDLKAKQAGHEQRLKTYRGPLSQNTESITIGDVTHPRAKVGEDVERSLRLHESGKRELANLKQRLELQRRAFDAAQVKLENVKGRMRELEAGRLELQRRMTLLQSQDRGNALAMDSSKLTEAEALLAKIKKRIDIAESKLSLNAEVGNVATEGLIPLNPPKPAQSLLERIDDALGQKEP